MFVFERANDMMWWEGERARLSILVSFAGMIQDQYRKKKIREKEERRWKGETLRRLDGRIRRQEGKGRWREAAERNAMQMLLFSSCVKRSEKGK